MTTCLGPTFAASCSAARAGIGRARAVDHAVFAAVEGEMVATHACFAGVADTGFAGPGRLFDLARAALADLGATLPHDALRDRRVRTIVVAPAREHEERRIAVECSAAGEYRDALVAMRSEALQETLAADRQAIASALASAEWSQGGTTIHEFHRGRTAFATAIRAAATALEGGTATACLLLSVDSLLDDETLDALFASDLLRTPDNANGIIPGEAAVAMLLEKRPADGGTPMATIDDASLEAPGAADPSPHEEARRLATTVARCHPSSDEVVHFSADVNGDVRRASEWGYAQVLAGWPRRMTHAFPASSFGDTGCAAGAVATATVVHDWIRGANPSRTAIVTLSEPAGPKAAIRLSRPAVPPIW